MRKLIIAFSIICFINLGLVSAKECSSAFWTDRLQYSSKSGKGMTCNSKGIVDQCQLTSDKMGGRSVGIGHAGTTASVRSTRIYGEGTSPKFGYVDNENCSNGNIWAQCIGENMKWRINTADGNRESCCGENCDFPDWALDDTCGAEWKVGNWTVGNANSGCFAKKNITPVSCIGCEMKGTSNSPYLYPVKNSDGSKSNGKLRVRCDGKWFINAKGDKRESECLPGEGGTPKDIAYIIHKNYIALNGKQVNVTYQNPDVMFGEIISSQFELINADKQLITSLKEVTFDLIKIKDGNKISKKVKFTNGVYSSGEIEINESNCKQIQGNYEQRVEIQVDGKTLKSNSSKYNIKCEKRSIQTPSKLTILRYGNGRLLFNSPFGSKSKLCLGDEAMLHVKALDKSNQLIFGYQGTVDLYYKQGNQDFQKYNSVMMTNGEYITKFKIDNSYCDISNIPFKDKVVLDKDSVQLSGIGTEYEIDCSATCKLNSEDIQLKLTRHKGSTSIDDNSVRYCSEDTGNLKIELFSKSSGKTILYDGEAQLYRNGTSIGNVNLKNGIWTHETVNMNDLCKLPENKGKVINFFNEHAKIFVPSFNRYFVSNSFNYILDCRSNQLCKSQTSGFLGITNLSERGFDLSWPEVQGADSYRVKIYRTDYTPISYVINKEFSSGTTSINTIDHHRLSSSLKYNVVVIPQSSGKPIGNMKSVVWTLPQISSINILSTNLNGFSFYYYNSPANRYEMSLYKIDKYSKEKQLIGSKNINSSEVKMYNGSYLQGVINWSGLDMEKYVYHNLLIEMKGFDDSYGKNPVTNYSGEFLHKYGWVFASSKGTNGFDIEFDYLQGMDNYYLKIINTQGSEKVYEKGFMTIGLDRCKNSSYSNCMVRVSSNDLDITTKPGNMYKIEIVAYSSDKKPIQKYSGSFQADPEIDTQSLTFTGVSSTGFVFMWNSIPGVRAYSSYVDYKGKPVRVDAYMYDIFDAKNKQYLGRYLYGYYQTGSKLKVDLNKSEWSQLNNICPATDYNIRINVEGDSQSIIKILSGTVSTLGYYTGDLLLTGASNNINLVWKHSNLVTATTGGKADLYSLKIYEKNGKTNKFDKIIFDNYIDYSTGYSLNDSSFAKDGDIIYSFNLKSLKNKEILQKDLSTLKFYLYGYKHQPVVMGPGYVCPIIEYK